LSFRITGGKDNSRLDPTVWAADGITGRTKIKKGGGGRSSGRRNSVFQCADGLAGGSAAGPWGTLTIRREIARGRTGFDFTLGIERLFSMDCRGAELCNRLGRVDGRPAQAFGFGPQGWVVRSLGFREDRWPTSVPVLRLSVVRPSATGRLVGSNPSDGRIGLAGCRQSAHSTGS
jgi:hypothetical protein